MSIFYCCLVEKLKTDNVLLCMIIGAQTIGWKCFTISIFNSHKFLHCNWSTRCSRLRWWLWFVFLQCRPRLHSRVQDLCSEIRVNTFDDLINKINESNANLFNNHLDVGDDIANSRSGISQCKFDILCWRPLVACASLCGQTITWWLKINMGKKANIHLSFEYKKKNRCSYQRFGRRVDS